MSTLAPASSYAAPRWRALALLTVVVLIAHTLVLTSVPSHFGPERPPSSEPAPAFVTRSIPAPPAEPAPPPPAAMPEAAPVPEPPRKKQAAAPEESPQTAIDSAATSKAKRRPADYVPDAPTEADLRAAAAEIAAATAANAAAAEPAAPNQAPVTAVALPGSVTLEYKMTGSAKGLNYYANAELRWQNTGETYEALMRVSALFLGSRSMTSTGQIGPDGLAPLRFSDKSRTEVAAHFEPDKNQISFSANTPTLAWVKGAQDRVSVFIQLGGMLAGNPAGFPAGSTIAIYTVGPRDADTWTFLVEAEEKLALPFGELTTVKLTRQPRREFDQKVEVWYAPSLGYLPVRNRITQSNGDSIDQQLSVLSKN
jgi:hypothetical protein